jgi:hypothetical protein
VIIDMTESSDQERESIRKELGKLEEKPKELVAAPQLREEEKPSSVLDHKSEARPALAKTKIDHTEVRSRDEKIQEKYKTPDQVSDEDYKVAPMSADKEMVKG